MVRRRAFRLTTIIMVLLSLLFSQLALANYACPPAASALATTMAMAMAMPGGEPCEGMGMDGGTPADPQQPVLCHQHCADAPQSFDPLQAPAVNAPAVVLLLVMPVVQDAMGDRTAERAERGQARPPPDPLFLSTLRLRV